MVSYLASLLTILIISFMLSGLSVLAQLSEDTSSSCSEPFECGMERIQSTRVPFLIHFLLIGLLFLIFDIELILVVLAIPAYANIFNSMIFWFMFVMIMVMGLEMEVAIGSLDWRL